MSGAAGGVKMNLLNDTITAHVKALWLGQHRDEIERATRNPKRSTWDKWFRREWHRATSHIARPQRRGAGGRRPFRGGGKRMKGEQRDGWLDELMFDVMVVAFREGASEEEIETHRKEVM
jgi:hypothetical protein